MRNSRFEIKNNGIYYVFINLTFHCFSCSKTHFIRTEEFMYFPGELIRSNRPLGYNRVYLPLCIKYMNEWQQLDNLVLTICLPFRGVWPS